MAKKLNPANLRTILSVAVLVGTEIIAASLALGWAVGGLLDLSDALRAVLVGACLLVGVYVLYYSSKPPTRSSRSTRSDIGSPSWIAHDPFS